MNLDMSFCATRRWCSKRETCERGNPPEKARLSFICYSPQGDACTHYVPLEPKPDPCPHCKGSGFRDHDCGDSTCGVEAEPCSCEPCP